MDPVVIITIHVEAINAAEPPRTTTRTWDDGLAGSSLPGSLHRGQIGIAIPAPPTRDQPRVMTSRNVAVSVLRLHHDRRSTNRRIHRGLTANQGTTVVASAVGLDAESMAGT